MGREVSWGVRMPKAASSGHQPTFIAPHTRNVIFLNVMILAGIVIVNVN